ncbi:MAG: hypothetical protein ACOYM8_05800 [Caulobacterales bacterium]
MSDPQKTPPMTPAPGVSAKPATPPVGAPAPAKPAVETKKS